jgi:MerR family copper efflux transcriptional regulator
VGTEKVGALGTQPVAATQPIACTLEPDAVPDRLEAWRATLENAVSRTAAADGALRIEFGDTTHLAEMARLVEAEQRCCAFLSFAIVIDSAGLALEVRAPASAADVVSAIFGSPGR